MNMTSILLNAILGVAVVVMVVAPLVWAVLTQHRDLPRAHASSRRRAAVTSSDSARARRALAPQRRFGPASRSEA